MPGAMFLFEDSSVGARQKETAGEGPLEHAIYTSQDRATLDHDEANHQRGEDVMCGDQGSKVRISQANTCLCVNGKYEWRKGMWITPIDEIRGTNCTRTSWKSVLYSISIII